MHQKRAPELQAEVAQSSPPNGRPQTMRAAAVSLTGLSAVFLFEMLDNSILNVALPTIGRDLGASATLLQWVTGAYAVVLGGLMLLFSTIADRFGRRRVMLAGLVLLALASAATALVTTPAQLIAVRAAMGIAAAMTTPGSMALAFRLFDTEALRVRALTLISTVCLTGLAIGPTVGGVVLAFAPWKVLLLINVPIAIAAYLGIRTGITDDRHEELHRDPLDVPGALLGTATPLSRCLLRFSSPSGRSGRGPVAPNDCHYNAELGEHERTPTRTRRCLDRSQLDRVLRSVLTRRPEHTQSDCSHGCPNVPSPKSGRAKM